MQRWRKGIGQLYAINLIFLKICKDNFIHDIYGVSERKRVKLSNNFTLFFSSYNIGIALIEHNWT